MTQADLDRATFRVGLEPAPRRQQITLSLDTGLIDYFKSKAGEHGYQALISETLRQAKEREIGEETRR
uniref:BrnA antitoxin of type II toxin-antitoxin system n=1 Tax=Candidatus Kentrum sp. DK TaxID=2126562 RepID=A0A450SAM6_9GAMM|nr:MAG: BrnA antitoxin of type II toxin-antitoxin system [Candidatus Kentron sp. DK]